MFSSSWPDVRVSSEKAVASGSLPNESCLKGLSSTIDSSFEKRPKLVLHDWLEKLVLFTQHFS